MEKEDYNRIRTLKDCKRMVYNTQIKVDISGVKIEDEEVPLEKVYGDFNFVLTCACFPEQYDVFSNDEYIAYIRKRYGHLTVYPVFVHEIKWEALIYEEYQGNSMSGTIDDRDKTLNKIAEKIKEYYEKRND